ncbi:hypothetical protein [uncultured Merdimonas sp.]|uniref:hypothetical protein n=1 Tax=uncultured Merdimonas sp. TaxID=2023269 RepID=UPI003209C062
MEKIKMTCTGCRNGCLMTVTVEDGEVVNVDGNGCMRGMPARRRMFPFPKMQGNNL